MNKDKSMTLKEAMTVTEADKIKAILDMAKRSMANLYDGLVKDIGETRRRKEKIESALHDATMEAGAMINTIVKGVDNHDKASMLANWRMRFKEEQESVKSMVEVNDISFDKTSELFLVQLDFNSRVIDASAALLTIFDVVDKASYVYQRQRAFEEKYKDYIPLATRIENLSNELNEVNSRLDRSRRDLAHIDDINNYLFGGFDVPTLANPSSIASRIRSIEIGMTPQDRFFLMAALVIVTVTRER